MANLAASSEDTLKPGDCATEVTFRRAHIVDHVDGELAHVLCGEVTMWSRRVQPGDGRGAWICIPDRDGHKPTCKTCEKRAAAAERRAAKA